MPEAEINMLDSIRKLDPTSEASSYNVKKEE